MMKYKYIKKISVILLITILTIIICVPKSYAIKPSDITGEISGEEIEFEFIEDLEKMITTIGTFLAVGAMMVIGIKYMSGSIEEKAQYKKTMMPYLIGCVLLFGASIIAPEIIEIFKESETIEDVGNVALGLIQTIGSVAAVGVLMILGIKYMMGSTEERASYKRSMLPYIIGAILIFGAVNLTAIVADMITVEESTTQKSPRCPLCGKPMSPAGGGAYKCPRCQILDR